MKKVKTVSDINNLKQEKNYLIQDEEFFMEDLELFFKDSNCKRRIDKIYIKAKPVLLEQIAERYDGTEQLVFPMIVKIDGERVSVSEYEEIWGGKC